MVKINSLTHNARKDKLISEAQRVIQAIESGTNPERTLKKATRVIKKISNTALSYSDFETTESDQSQRLMIWRLLSALDRFAHEQKLPKDAETELRQIREYVSSASEELLISLAIDYAENSYDDTEADADIDDDMGGLRNKVDDYAEKTSQFEHFISELLQYAPDLTVGIFSNVVKTLEPQIKEAEAELSLIKDIRDVATGTKTQWDKQKNLTELRRTVTFYLKGLNLLSALDDKAVLSRSGLTSEATLTAALHASNIVTEAFLLGDEEGYHASREFVDTVARILETSQDAGVMPPWGKFWRTLFSDEKMWQWINTSDKDSEDREIPLAFKLLKNAPKIKSAEKTEHIDSCCFDDWLNGDTDPSAKKALFRAYKQQDIIDLVRAWRDSGYFDTQKNTGKTADEIKERVQFIFDLLPENVFRYSEYYYLVSDLLGITLASEEELFTDYLISIEDGTSPKERQRDLAAFKKHLFPRLTKLPDINDVNTIEALHESDESQDLLLKQSIISAILNTLIAFRDNLIQQAGYDSNQDSEDTDLYIQGIAELIPTLYTIDKNAALVFTELMLYYVPLPLLKRIFSQDVFKLQPTHTDPKTWNENLYVLIEYLKQEIRAKLLFGTLPDDEADKMQRAYQFIQYLQGRFDFRQINSEDEHDSESGHDLLQRPLAFLKFHQEDKLAFMVTQGDNDSVVVLKHDTGQILFELDQNTIQLMTDFTIPHIEYFDVSEDGAYILIGDSKNTVLIDWRNQRYKNIDVQSQIPANKTAKPLKIFRARFSTQQGNSFIALATNYGLYITDRKSNYTNFRRFYSDQIIYDVVWQYKNDKKLITLGAQQPPPPPESFTDKLAQKITREKKPPVIRYNAFMQPLVGHPDVTNPRKNSGQRFELGTIHPAYLKLLESGNLEWSPNGQTIAYTEYGDDEEDSAMSLTKYIHIVEMWHSATRINLASRKDAIKWKYIGRVGKNSITWSPDSQALALALKDGDFLFVYILRRKDDGRNYGRKVFKIDAPQAEPTIAWLSDDELAIDSIAYVKGQFSGGIGKRYYYTLHNETWLRALPRTSTHASQPAGEIHSQVIKNFAKNYVRDVVGGELELLMSGFSGKEQFLNARRTNLDSSYCINDTDDFALEQILEL